MKNPLDKSILERWAGSLRHAEAPRAFVEKHPLIVEWLPNFEGTAEFTASTIFMPQ
jgi:hypothetical protein